MEKLKTILPPLAVLVALSGLWWLVVVQTESEVRIDDMVRTGPGSKGIVISQHVRVPVADGAAEPDVWIERRRPRRQEGAGR